MFRRRPRRPAEDSLLHTVHVRCHAAGCRRRDGVRCSYIDKRSRSCPTAWCPQHVGSVAGFPYCRRHASTMAAIQGAEMVAGLPDLDNRAPSLVGWVSRDLDAPMRELVGRIAPSRGATLVTDPVRPVITPGRSTRRWAKTWKILENSSIVNRVSIEVDEQDDQHVSARVDTELIGEGFPPWISDRLAGRRVDAATAEAERRVFTSEMVRSIEQVVTGREFAPRP